MRLVIISNRTLIEILVVFWVGLSVFYIIKTPASMNSHDYFHHIAYTNTIFEQGRLPINSQETGEVHQPPLYYLINNIFLFNPQTKNYHIHYVRALSVIYGALSLIIMLWLLQHITKNNFINLVTLLFIASTPKFLFTFTTYNNDSLGNFLCIAIVALVYELFQKWSFKYSGLLLLISTIAVYTKYTAVWCLLVISFLLFFIILLKKRTYLKKSLGIICILALSICLHFPYLKFHNHHYTGKYFIENSPVELMEHNISLKTFFNGLKSILVIPNKESFKQMWSVPWAYPGWFPIHEATKMKNYVAFSFITSIIGEWTFLNLNYHINILWTVILIHLLFHIICIFEFLRSFQTKLAMLSILLVILIHIVVVSLFVKAPIFGCYIDFRFIAWTWAMWAILCTSAMHNSFILKIFLGILLLTGTILQCYILNLI